MTYLRRLRMLASAMGKSKARTVSGPLGHERSANDLGFWRELALPLVRRNATPLYIFSAEPIERALCELDSHFSHLPVRNWLSCKTQPLPALLRWWRTRGGSIEVVSEFELLAAFSSGFPPERILVNGPAKHHWLPRHAKRRLLVNFDSTTEASALAPLAKKLDWRVGIRCHTREEFDPEEPTHSTQFGMPRDEAVQTLRRLKRSGVRLEIIHFHLRTNVQSPSIYSRALKEVAAICDAADFAPRYVDCGGGFPPPDVLTRDGAAIDKDFSLGAMARVYEEALESFPNALELWLENGRWLSARSGVLVIKVLDVKTRGKQRHLICDGGRTTNALISNWEQHTLIPLEQRAGKLVQTTVNGPTCMAFDKLGRFLLPRSIRPGDHLLWLDAGAYHLSWETHFSHGLATVFWHVGRTTHEVRRAERFTEWWGKWK